MTLGVQEQSLFSAAAGGAAAVATYVPLYRKYRPQSFADVVGQKAIIQTLSNAICSQKVAHAYLLCGPRGTGKTSTARIFAKSLNCEQGPTLTPCQVCDSCRGITAGNALDVMEFDAASNTGVENARELIENVQFAPMAGRYKIYIIDEVHMLSTSAFNALLKTLEEPPPRVIFIFATTEAHKVLPTIISRCQRFDFSRITTGEIAEQLGRVAEAETIRIAPDALMTIARHARGGMRDALGLLDQVGVISRAQPGVVIAREDVTRFIGALAPEVLLSITDAIAKQSVANLLEAVNGVLEAGSEPLQLIKELTQHLRNLFMVQAVGRSGKVPDADALELPPELMPQLEAQASLFAPEELPQMLEALARIERHMRHTQEATLWMEVGLLELACRHDIRKMADLEARLARLEAQLAGGGPAFVAKSPAHPSAGSSAPVSPSAPAATPVSRPVVAETAPTQSEPAPRSSPKPQSSQQLPAGNHDWDAVVAAVASRPTRALLEHTFLMEASETSLTVGVVSEPILKNLSAPDKTLHLNKAVEQVFGRSLKLNLVFEKDRSRGALPLRSVLPGSSSKSSEERGGGEPPVQASSPALAPSIPSESLSVQSQPSGEAVDNSFGGEMPADVAEFSELATTHGALRSNDLPSEPKPESFSEELSVQKSTVQESPLSAISPSSVPSDSGDLAEAKSYTLSLLQGQLIE